MLGDSINTNDINTNDPTSSTIVIERQNATTELCDNNNVSVDNNYQNKLCVRPTKLNL